MCNNMLHIIMTCKMNTLDVEVRSALSHWKIAVMDLQLSQTAVNTVSPTPLWQSSGVVTLSSPRGAPQFGEGLSHFRPEAPAVCHFYVFLVHLSSSYKTISTAPSTPHQHRRALITLLRSLESTSVF